MKIEDMEAASRGEETGIFAKRLGGCWLSVQHRRESVYGYTWGTTSVTRETASQVLAAHTGQRAQLDNRGG